MSLDASHWVFTRGRSQFAIPARLAVEVVLLPELTRVPGAPSFVPGVFAHHDDILPAVDFSYFYGPTATGAPRHAILTRVDDIVAAVVANRVLGAMDILDEGAPLGEHGIRRYLFRTAGTEFGTVTRVDLPAAWNFLGHKRQEAA